MYIDTHCHINNSEFDADRAKVIERAIKTGVTQFIVIGAGGGLASSQSAVALAATHPGIFATVGIHPHDAGRMTADTDRDEIERLARSPKVVAIGEIGLDYYYPEPPPAEQKEAFAYSLDLARRLQLPIVIHDRDAHDDIYNTVKAAAMNGAISGVMHCFGGDIPFAQKILDLGLHISVPGIVTFSKKAEVIQSVAAYVPIDRLLIETDAPYLAPHPYRGKRNEPAFVVEVARKIAELKNLPLEEVARITSENARRLFKLT